MYFFISEIGWMFRPHHHPTDFLLWKRRPRARSSMLPAGRSAAPERLPPGFPIPAQPPCDLALTEPTKVLPEDPPHDCSLLRIHAQLPLLILIETEQPRRIHMHYLFHCPPHKPQQHFVTIVAVLPRRDNFPEAGPSIPWLHFTSRGQCLRLHLITRRPAMFMFVALLVLFIFLE